MPVALWGDVQHSVVEWPFAHVALGTVVATLLLERLALGPTLQVETSVGVRGGPLAPSDDPTLPRQGGLLTTRGVARGQLRRAKLLEA